MPLACTWGIQVEYSILIWGQAYHFAKRDLHRRLRGELGDPIEVVQWQRRLAEEDPEVGPLRERA